MLVLAAVAGISTVAQAQTKYNIWVDGIQVTSQNATTGIGGTGIKSGKVTYDANSSTLLLDNAVIVRGGNACIEIKEEKVKVKFRGVCALSCSSSNVDYPTVYISKSTDFVCEAGSHTTIYRSASHAVWLYNDNTTLTINGPGQLKVDTRNYLDTDGVTVKTTSDGKSGFVGKNGTQVLMLQSNHNVTINSCDACLWDFKDVQCAGNGLLYCMATNNSNEPCFVKVRALKLSGNQSVRLPSGAAFNSSDQSIVAAGVKVYAADVAIAGGSVVKVSFGSPNGKLDGSGKAGQLKLYGDGYYVSGQSVTVTAVNDGTDKEGIEFVGWKTTGGSLQSSNMKYTFNASATTLNAHYKYKQYTVTTSVTPTGSGTITRTGNANYWGASVSLKATANSGWKFVGWREKTIGNTIISTDNPLGLILGRNWDLVAVFDRDYDVVVAGTKVTAQNSNNITSTNMTGTAKYDASTKTLTLTGVTIKNVDYCIRSGEDLKNIVFSGTCNLSSSNCCVRYSSSTTRELNITCQSGANVKMETTTSGKNECIWYDYQGTYSINGPGKLTLKSTNYGINIRAAGALTFANGHDVTITSANNGIQGNGANGSLTISGTGKMTITPGSNYTAIKDFPTFTLNNQQEIIYPDGATYSTTNKRVERNSAIYTGEVQIAQRYYTISVSSNNTNYGSVSGGGSILKGSSVTVSASAKTGYKFVKWTENGTQVSTSASYTFTADKNRTLQAVFEPIPYSISASANPSAAGTVQGAGSYNYNTQASLSAVPKTGYTFVKWTEGGSQVSTANPYSFTVTKARTLVAQFEAVQYNITASASPAAGGTVTGGGNKQYGESVTLKATPNTGYKFVRWTEGGSQVSTSASYTFTVDKARTLVAVFEKLTYNITASASPAAGGTVTGGGTKEHGESVTVKATPNTGYKFVRWTEGGSQVSANATYTFTADKNRTLVAVFEKLTYSITASASPAAGGTVTGGGTKEHGASVTLTATPKTGYKFVRWTEGGSQVSTNASYTFTVSGARSLTAVFEKLTYTIAVSASPAAGGTVTGGGTKEHGESVTVKATPNTGYKFVRWTEGGSQVSTNATYTFTADKNRTLVAVFEEEGTPDVAVTGVSLSPTTKAMKVGEKFTLVPQISPSNATNQNVTWISSDATVATVSNGEVTAEGVGTATITVTTVDGNKTATCEVTVSAAAATTYALTIVSPTNGTLTASPNGNINEGTEVTLTATPASGYKLKALKAYKTGETSTVVAISENKFNMPGYPVTVEAEFEEEASSETYYLLTVVSPTNGTLTASPSGYISEGTEVTLTATPASGYKLKALKAYKTGEPSTTVAITGNKFNMPAYEVTVEAEFEKTSSGGGGGGTTYYTLTYIASAGGSIKGVSIQSVAQGGSGQEVEAVAQEGYRFVKWSDGRTTAKRTDFYVQANLIVTAEFEKSNATGIFDIKLDALSVYPNPTTGQLWVSVPELAEGTAAEVHVYNANGQLLQRVAAHGASAGSAASRLSIDLSGYPAGVYIIRVGNAVAKVVKQ